MSILNRYKRPVYRAVGGALTAGEIAQQEQEAAFAAAAGTSLLNTNASFEDVAAEAAGWHADTANAPQYYTDSTVAGVNDTLQSGYDSTANAANQFDTTTNDLIAQRNDMMDPTGAYSQQLADQAITGVNKSWGQTGTLGSARNAQAATGGAQSALLANQNAQLDAIGGLRDSFFTSGDKLTASGDAQRAIEQQVVDEDIKRFNYAQLAPSAQLDQILAASQLSAAAAEGNVSAQTATGSAFGNTGGPVYANKGMMINQMEGAAMEAPMPEGNGIMNGMTPEMTTEAPMMEDPMMSKEILPELDRIEMALESLVQATGADVTITRKSSKKKAKKGSK